MARVGGYFHDVGRLRGLAEPSRRREAAAELASMNRFPNELAQLIAEQPHEDGRAGGALVARPLSKTSALVALADRVEDALRGREGEWDNPGDLGEAIQAEVRAAVLERVLDEAALELRELAAVSSAFTESLAPRFISASHPPAGFRLTSSPAGAPS